MFDVYIQNRLLKTPQGNLVQAPTLALAKAIEEEWEKDPSPHYRQKPLTSLVATALDRVTKERAMYTTYILEAISKDCILFWATTPESLVKLQDEKWGFVIEEVNRGLGLHLKPTTTLSLISLSAEEEAKAKEFIDCQTNFKLAGFAHLITLTSSFCVSYLVIQGLLSADKAWDIAYLHEQEQRRIWGEDEEALLREKSQKEEFLETVRFLKLIV